MQPPLRSFQWALGIGWVALALAAWQYARIKQVAPGIAFPLAAAFLIEYSFYLASGFEAVRQRVAAWPKPYLAAAIAASGLLPWLVYATLTGTAQLGHLAFLVIVFTLIAGWYVILPHTLPVDLLLLALLAAAILSGVLRTVYPSPLAWVRLEILGHLALIHTAVFSVLAVRGLSGVSLGFVSQKREIFVGLRYAALFCIVGLPLAWLLEVVRLPPQTPPLWRIVATLLGAYWVVAYSEEFFFRGVLQNLLGKRLPAAAAVGVTSILFGLVHLNYSRHFPNWRIALLAGIAGVCYGLAYRTARSVGASMVTHAVVVTLWKTLGA